MSEERRKEGEYQNGWDDGYENGRRHIADLKKRIEELEGALEFYTNGYNYVRLAGGSSFVELDEGDKARAALSKAPKEGGEE